MSDEESLSSRSSDSVPTVVNENGQRSGESIPIDEFSYEDRRIIIRVKLIERSLSDFKTKCLDFNVGEGNHKDGRALQNFYQLSIQPQLEEIRSLLNNVTDIQLLDDLSSFAESARQECYEAYSHVLAYVEHFRPTNDNNFGLGPRLPGQSGSNRSIEMEELKLHSALLPSIPTFSGELSKFPEFIESYKHAVHNRKISPVQKLSALRSKLRGAPLSLVEHYGSSPDDYEMAYKNLINYYTGKNRIASSLIDSLLDLKLVEKTDLPALEALYSKSSNLSTAISNLKLPDLGDYFMFSLLFKRLPNALRDKYIAEQTNFADEIPSSQALLKFISDQLTILRARPAVPSKPLFQASRSKSPTSFRSSSKSSHPMPFLKTHSFAQPKVSKTDCYFCGDKHLIYHCPQFRKGDWKTRCEFVHKFPLCRVCLSGKHQTSECLSNRSCSRCSERHHSLLHPQTYGNERPSNPSSSTYVLTQPNQKNQPHPEDFAYNSRTQEFTRPDITTNFSHFTTLPSQFEHQNSSPSLSSKQDRHQTSNEHSHEISS